MTNLKSGYIIEELLDKLTLEIEDLNHLLQYKLITNDKGSQLDDSDSLLLIIDNIISRGIPTRASVLITKTLYNESEIQYQLVKDSTGSIKIVPQLILTEQEKAEIKYLLKELLCHDLSEIAGEYGSRILTIIQLLIKPLQIARIQKILIHALLHGLLSINKRTWKIGLIERDLKCGELALLDIHQLIDVIYTLSGRKQRIPKIIVNSIDSTGDNEDLDLIIDHAYFKDDINSIDRSGTGIITIRSCIEANEEKADFFYHSAEKYSYPELGNLIEVLEDNSRKTTFKFVNDDIERSLLYLLQNIFRKTDFLPGQLSILNRALQGLSVIGLLPTGGGKSLTYQLTGLLQPGVTIIVDPINSLMRDQIDKLRENYIDCCAYINSYNTDEEREAILGG